ncbi:MAG: hypothetical protein K8I03_09285 [Ignavibacteria bacterium]|nr:hypothetical protein [Ignavibacteria bacterium]
MSSSVSGFRLQAESLIIFVVITFWISGSSFSQIIDSDTSNVIIRKTKKEKPQEYNISDVIVKRDRSKIVSVIRVDLDIPIKTTFKLAVSDTSSNVLIYLVNDQTLNPGVYRVKWEMPVCMLSNSINTECYSPGKYFVEFETDQFIFVRDFFI